MTTSDSGLGGDPLTCIRTVKRAVEQKKQNAKAVRNMIKILKHIYFRLEKM